MRAVKSKKFTEPICLKKDITFEKTYLKVYSNKFKKNEMYFVIFFK